MKDDKIEIDEHFDRLVIDHKADRDAKQKAQQAKQKAEGEAEHLQSIQQQMAAVLARKKSDRAVPTDTKDLTTPKHLDGTATQLEYMRACLCRI